MFFIITLILIVTGILLLHNQKVAVGYSVLALGWIHAIVQNIISDHSIEAAFTTLFIGLAFVWFVQYKMESHRWVLMEKSQSLNRLKEVFRL